MDLLVLKSDRTPDEMVRMARLGAAGKGPYWKNKAIKVGDKIHDAQPHETFHEPILSRIAHTVKPHEELSVGYRGHDNEFYPERFMHHAIMHHERENGKPRESDKVIFANHTLRRARSSVVAEQRERQAAGEKRRAEGMAKFRELMRSMNAVVIRSATPLVKALHHFFRAPALNVEGHVYEGKPGETHGDIFDRMSEEHKRSHHLDDGFVGHDGNYYSRAAARHAVGQTNKPATKDPYISPGAATSEQLADEQRAHPNAKPKKMPEHLRAYGETPTVLIKSAEGGYFYHATHEWNAHDIAHDKLRPHRPWHGTDQSSWPDGETEKRSYFHHDRNQVGAFHPEGGKPVVLRVHSSHADFKREKGTGDHYVKHTIRPEHIEVETGDGTYKPLKQWAGVSKSWQGSPREVDLVLKHDGPVKYTEHFQGIPISIENPAGSYRKWYDPHTGKKGANKMLWPYGYFQRTEAVDGDSVDCFVGPHKDAPYAYIIRQMKAPTFEHYDEDKVMLGARSPEEAKRIYLAHYDDPRYFGRMDIVPMDKLQQKLAENRQEPNGGPLKWGPSVKQHPTVGGTQA